VIKKIVKRGSKAELLFTHCGRHGQNASSCESLGQKLLSLLRKKTFCGSVTRLLEDELQNQKLFGGHWSLLEEPQKKHRAPFQEKVPCKLLVIIKKALQIPGGFSSLFWRMNQ